MSSVGALEVQPVMQLCRALGDETRLRIVALLAHGELCTCHVEAALDLSQPNASRHLAVLRTAGIVEPRREGNWIYYSLARQSNEARRKVLAAIVKNFDGEETLKQDVEKLRRMKGPVTCR
ncbi:MAG: winged helix-turn-helix transcriptional regulator [Polyangiaceae bacterium]|nr:winged helix-turn-helix transcriptional regulator [Polyangiaceae bacterium]